MSAKKANPAQDARPDAQTSAQIADVEEAILAEIEASADQESFPEDAAEDAPAADSAESIAALQKELAERQDALLRARAEAENLRRRAQEEVGKASKFAIEKFAAALLPVRDSLESALLTENQTLENLRQGVELTLKQLDAAFGSAGVAEENPLEKAFDPNRHQAISTVPTSDAEPNTVVTVLQKGYLIRERVLRPALVMVAQAEESK